MKRRITKKRRITAPGKPSKIVYILEAEQDKVEKYNLLLCWIYSRYEHIDPKDRVLELEESQLKPAFSGQIFCYENGIESGISPVTLESEDVSFFFMKQLIRQKKTSSNIYIVENNIEFKITGEDMKILTLEDVSNKAFSRSFMDFVVALTKKSLIPAGPGVTGFVFEKWNEENSERRLDLKIHGSTLRKLFGPLVVAGKIHKSVEDGGQPVYKYGPAPGQKKTKRSKATGDHADAIKKVIALNVPAIDILEYAKKKYPQLRKPEKMELVLDIMKELSASKN